MLAWAKATFDLGARPTTLYLISSAKPEDAPVWPREGSVARLRTLTPGRLLEQCANDSGGRLLEALEDLEAV